MFFNYLVTEIGISIGFNLSGILVKPEIELFQDSNSYGQSLANRWVVLELFVLPLPLQPGTLQLQSIAFTKNKYKNYQLIAFLNNTTKFYLVYK